MVQRQEQEGPPFSEVQCPAGAGRRGKVQPPPATGEPPDIVQVRRSLVHTCPPRGCWRGEGLCDAGAPFKVGGGDPPAVVPSTIVTPTS